ncbi:MAG: ABC transporter ATP-binding protein/permease [candidate division KSB1 bacterium]|nr:ABC transporter ATP-binding protein/permease [candidate division KSB1 bacterium]
MSGFFRDLAPLLPYWRRYRRAYLTGLLAVVAATGLQLSSPWILRYGIDALVRKEAPGRIALYALALVAVTALAGLFRYLTRMTMIGASRWIEYDLRNDYFAHLLRMSPSFYHRWRTGDLMARATNDLNAVRSMLGPGIMQASGTVLVALGAVTQMFSLDATLAAVALGPLPLISAVVFHLMRRIRHLYDRIQATYSRLSEKAQENLSGIRIVKSYVAENREIELFGRINDEYVRRNLRLAKVRGSLVGTIEILAGVGILCVLWIGGYRVIRGHMSLGELVAFMSFLAMLSWPMIAIGWTLNLLEQGRASLVRIQQVMEERPEIADGPQTNLSHDRVEGEIRFDRVSFRYDGPFVLREIDLEIPRGASVGIVGRTGAGKSTLIHLVPRLYDPTEGCVRIDGHDVREIPLGVLRRHVAVVPQESFLFSDTIAANIAFGEPEVDEGRILWAAEMAGLAEDIRSFPHGLETVLGERGINLSGGQKQRVALARALIRDPAVLILDDALSAVDADTEERILRNLRSIMSGRTILVVSHRLSVVKDLDFIVVLDEGRIAEVGTHDELLRLRGIYWEMYEKQRLEATLAIL